MRRTDAARTQKWRQLSRLATFICTFAVAACAPIEDAYRAAQQTIADRGIGGTGISGGEGGIGGTGIFGTITGFGSVIVNGLEVEFDETTPLSFDSAPGTSDGLRVGQVVTIEAEAVADQLIARSIAVQSAVSGPISSLSPEQGTLVVLGQSIVLAAGAPVDGGQSQLTIGQWVTVSGLRRPDGRIVASRIEQRPAGGLASLRGAVTAASSSELTVSGQTIAVASGGSVPEPGRIVFVTGRINQSGLIAETVELEPIVPFDGRMRRLSLEGIVSASGDRLVVNGFSVPLDGARRAGDTSALTAGSRITIDAQLGVDGTLQVEKIFRIEPTRADGRGTGAPPSAAPDREPSLMRR